MYDITGLEIPVSITLSGFSPKQKTGRWRMQKRHLELAVRPHHHLLNMMRVRMMLHQVERRHMNSYFHVYAFCRTFLSLRST